MKRILSLLLVFLFIFNIMAPSMAITNMYKESISELSHPVDCEQCKEVAAVSNSTEKFFIPYHKGYTLLKSGRLKIFTDQNRIISEKIFVEEEDENKIYHFKNLSAKYGNCFYVIYDENNKVLDYLRATESTTGEILEGINIIVPKNASYIRVACDLNVNNKMFEGTKSKTTNNKKSEPAVISFIDDDCKKEVYSELYPLIQKYQLPYTLACPPDNIKDEESEYLTKKQLVELYNYGVNIISHHSKEYAMTQFKSIEDYEKDVKESIKKIKDIGKEQGIEIDVNGVAYPNGIIKEEYIPVVKENFKLGFTTDRGINTLPYESYYIDRCELFPENGIYNINDAKKIVNDVVENGGWLVFMTHSHYDTFSAKQLEELVLYIKERHVEILNVTDVIEKYSNTIERGIIKKPLTDMAEDFFAMDCKGSIYTNNASMIKIEENKNNIEVIEKSPIKWIEMPIDYNYASTLQPNKKEKDIFYELGNFSEEEQIFYKKQNVAKIKVIPNATYKFANMSAQNGNCFYVIYDSNYKVLDYKSSLDLSTGETLEEVIITMPSNASHIKIACDLNVSHKMFKAYRESK